MLPCAAPKDVNPNLEGPSTNFMAVLSANVITNPTVNLIESPLIVTGMIRVKELILKAY